MIGCLTWICLAGAVYLFWSTDWRLGLGIVLAMLSFSIEIGNAIRQLQEYMDTINRKIG